MILFFFVSFIFERSFLPVDFRRAVSYVFLLHAFFVLVGERAFEQEGEQEKRRAAFEGIYQVNEKLMNIANPDCMVQHCLPAHRGEEITAEVFEAHSAEIFEEAENRLHAQKAVMVLLME